MQKNVSVVDVLDLSMEKQVTSCQGFVDWSENAPFLKKGCLFAKLNQHKANVRRCSAKWFWQSGVAQLISGCELKQQMDL